jgi:hypothetical protein
MTLAAAAGFGSAARGDDTPACLASLALRPETVVTGQQVLYRLRILSRDDVTSVEWVEIPSFPGFRAEGLSGQPHPEVTRGGASYRVREENRALFAERPGSFTLGGAGLRCRVRGAADRDFFAPIPDALLTVVAPPETGRPPDFTGVVGPLTLRSVVEPRALALGESARLTVVLQGPGNLWDAPDPLAAEIADAELFRRRPELRFESGSRLLVRVQFVYDLVPRREGRLELPAIRVPYFDPDAHGYEIASAPSVELAVAPPASRPDLEARDEAAAAPGRLEPRPAPAQRRRGSWLILGLALAGAAIGGFALAYSRRSRGASRERLAAADEARARGDREAETAALARALREGLALVVPEVHTLATEEILARASAPAAERAARLLAAIDRSRFDPDAPPPDRADVDRALADLSRGRRRDRAGSLREWLGRQRAAWSAGRKTPGRNALP